MSTVGLRRVGNFNEALAAALRDDAITKQNIGIGLRNAATRIIHSPDFQRVRDTLQTDLAEQERKHINEQQFQHNITNLSVDASIRRSDLDYLVNHLQQPPPAPPVPPNPSDAAADRERLLAELDGMQMKRNDELKRQLVAEMNARELAAQRVETPVQQIVREYHQTPIYIPSPQVPQQPQQPATNIWNYLGQTFHQNFIQQTQPPQDEIPITYTNSGGGPPPAPGAGAIMKSGYGPVKKLAKSRTLPFEKGPSTGMMPGGATSPMPVPAVPTSREVVPIRRDFFPSRPASGSGNPPPKPSKRKIESTEVSIKPKTNRFPGEGRKIPANEFGFSGASGNIPTGNKAIIPSQPFTGFSQRIPAESELRKNAIQRMQEIAERGLQSTRKVEMVQRGKDLRRAINRGMAPGDVVPVGKRKRDDEDDRGIISKARQGDRRMGPQRFSIAT